jgi:hypothetical protein
MVGSGTTTEPVSCFFSSESSQLGPVHHSCHENLLVVLPEDHPVCGCIESWQSSPAFLLSLSARAGGDCKSYSCASCLEHMAVVCIKGGRTP